MTDKPKRNATPRPPGQLRKPSWLRSRRAGGSQYNDVHRLLQDAELHTVCQSANCPNRGECFTSRTATFLLMGDVCTRHCTFCNIPGGKVGPLDPDEPRRVAEAVRKLDLKFAVVTSVNRDDLPDGGSAHFAETIRQIKRTNPGCGVEVLIPDYMGDDEALQITLEAEPEILNHNLETVPRLYPRLRTSALYERSLEVLQRSRRWADAHGGQMKIKTGIMLGVGEEHDEVVQLMQDAVDHGVQILTIGQYLQPSKRHHPVIRYVEPAEFDELAVIGRRLGLQWVEAGPLVRSSYHAREQSESVLDDPSARAAGE